MLKKNSPNKTGDKIINLKSLLTVTLFFIFANSALFAQTDFRSGFIINNELDTIHGFIDYKGNKANAKKCLFREEPDSENITFTPKDIQAYRFTDSKYYVSKKLVVKGEAKKVFLEFLVNGTIDIYYYRDIDGEHFFVDMGDNKLVRLNNDKFEVLVDNKIYLKESTEYIGQLKYTFRECPSLFNRIDNLSLTHKSLINITQDYHQEVCPDEECVVYKKKMPKIKAGFGPLLGLNYQSVTEPKELPTELYYLENINTNLILYPSIGLYLKNSMPYFNEKLYFQLEVLYSKVKTEWSTETPDPLYNMIYYNYLDLTQHILNNNLLLKYYIPAGKANLVIQGGTLINYSLKSDFNRIVESRFLSGETFQTYYSENNPFSDLVFGFNLGIGISSSINNSREVYIDLRYKKGYSLLAGVYKSGLKYDYVSLNVGFQINK